MSKQKPLLSRLKKGDAVMVPTYENWTTPIFKKATFTGWHTPEVRLWVRDEAGYAETYLVSEVNRSASFAETPKYGYRRTWE